MLNFNSIDNSNTFAIPAMNSGNFAQMPTISTTSSQPNNLNYLNSSSAQNADMHQSVIWARADGSASNNCGSSNSNSNSTNNNNITNSIRSGDQQKDYLQTVIHNDESDERSALNSMTNYLQQKGSENVKRFSVNNLLQLANNCRALTNEQRHTVDTGTGKCDNQKYSRIVFFVSRGRGEEVFFSKHKLSGNVKKSGVNETSY